MPHGLVAEVPTGRSNDLVAAYNARFEERIFAASPQSLLDIGCGQGGLLERAAQRGVCATGVDIDPERVASAGDKGLDVREASAERLPFDDAQFDWAVCARSAHHFADLGAGLSEALRISRHGVFVLDPWFDESIPSQATGAKLERWMKAVDRAHGHVNNGPLSAGDFLAALSDRNVTAEIEHWLKLEPVGLAGLETDHLARLRELSDRTAFEGELDALMEEALRTGVTRAGMIVLVIQRR